MPLRYRALWSIPDAGPSVSTFHFLTANEAGRQGIVGRIQALFAAWTSVLPDDVTVSFDSEITEVDTASGELVAAFPVTPGTPVTGVNTGVWAAGAGFRVVWSTGDIRLGRRVRGSTFIVPVHAASFTNTGKPGPNSSDDVVTAAQACVNGLSTDGTPMVVYSRPKPGLPGAVSLVDKASVSSVAATLRSRKY